MLLAKVSVHLLLLVFICMKGQFLKVLPGMTSWPGGKVATVVAVCTPLVRLPVVSPSPTYWIRTFFFWRFMRMCRIRFACFVYVFSKCCDRSPSGGWLRWGCLFSVILTGGVKVVVWPSGLRASFGANHLLMQPGLHLWVLVPERPPQVETPQLPGPDRQ